MLIGFSFWAATEADIVADLAATLRVAKETFHD
jgi:hypothetical protein